MPYQRCAVVADKGGAISTITAPALWMVSADIEPVIRSRTSDAVGIGSGNVQGAAVPFAVHRHWAGTLDLWPSLEAIYAVLPMITGGQWQRRSDTSSAAPPDLAIGLPGLTTELHLAAPPSVAVAPRLAMVRRMDGSDRDLMIRGGHVAGLSLLFGADVLRATEVRLAFVGASDDHIIWRPDAGEGRPPTMIGPVRLTLGPDKVPLRLASLQLHVTRVGMRPLFGIYETTPFGFADHGVQIDIAMTVVTDPADTALADRAHLSGFALTLPSARGNMVITLPQLARVAMTQIPHGTLPAQHITARAVADNSGVEPLMQCLFEPHDIQRPPTIKETSDHS